mgnify:CR=1 FL=1
MRTMKKIVALSLVLAMALSMMASAASFKDQATINEDLIDEKLQTVSEIQGQTVAFILVQTNQEGFWTIRGTWTDPV